MSVENAKKLIDECKELTNIESVDEYTKGFNAGVSTEWGDMIKALSNAYQQRESLSRDYRLGIVDGAIEVMGTVLGQEEVQEALAVQ